MTHRADNASTKSRTRLAAQIGWTILIGLTLYCCYFAHLGAIGFVGPDEPRYAWIARAMAQTGDWVTPRLYGRPWFEKPPLYYWGAALSFKLFGVSEAAARLPSAFCALLATLAVGWLALRIYGAETARWLLILLPTTVGMIGFSHAAATDMPFAAMLMLAMVCAAVVLRLTRDEQLPGTASTAPGLGANPPDNVSDPHSPQNASTAKAANSVPWAPLILFGVFLGLAVLAKGPAGVILCGASVFFWALFSRCWRDAFRLAHPAAILPFCAVSLSWYILCARRNPDFLRVFIVEHNFKRYLTPEFQHIQPFWFYIPILFAALLPWSLGFVGLFAESTKGRRAPVRIPPADLFLLSFGLFPILFFSASQSKLPGYILPAFAPFVCLLAARLASALRGGGLAPRLTPVLFALSVAGIGLGLQRFAAHQVLGEVVAPARCTWFVWVPLVAAAVAAVALAVIHRLRASVIAAQAGVVIAVFALGAGLHWTDAQWSARGILEQTSALRRTYPDAEIFVHDVPRGFRYGMNFYLGREVRDWKPSDAPLGWVYTGVREEHTLQTLGYQCADSLGSPAAVLCGPPARDLARLPQSRGQPQ